MRRRLLATFGALGLLALFASLALPARAAEPAALVQQLGSDDFRTREAAAAALERAGPAALPALRAAVAGSDPEVRHRAAPILQKLQRAATSAERLAAPKVTLNFKAVPLAHAVAELRARTGVNLTLDLDRVADPLRPVTVATAELPVWEAVEAFSAAAGLRESFAAELELPKPPTNVRRVYALPPVPPGPEAVPVVLIDGRGRAPGARSNGVRVLALPRAFPGHRVTLGTGETALCLDVAPLPGLNWNEVLAVKVTRLIDDAGRVGSGAAARPVDDGPMDLEGVVVWGGPGVKQGFARFDRPGAPAALAAVPNPRVVPVPLRLATPHAKSLRRLDGSVFGELLLPNEPLVTVTAPEKHTGRTLEGPGEVALTLESVRADNDGTTVAFVLRYPSPWVAGARRGQNPGGLWPEAPRGPNHTPVLRAFDASGKELTGLAASGSTDASADGRAIYERRTWTFLAAPAKLVVTGPRPVVVEVPFALENVPLP
ncbi:MAG: hypothetical protein FJ304_05180 [Planctomycetes bacterium]|nr:hypothetical protein [Planctomycetota bacterium]